MEAIGNDIIFSGFRNDVGQELFKLNTANITIPGCDSQQMTAAGTIDQTISSYPNPFVSTFILRVDGPEGDTYQIQMFDMNNIQAGDTRDLQYNEDNPIGDHLKSGIYVLKVIEGNTVTVKRIVKN
jgi:expansin (peptidoglycan-binding protein)